jgi:death-on-curing protein
MADELYRGRAPMPAFQFLGGAQGEAKLDAALALLESPYYANASAAASAMFNALINNHPFQDGNKRFAVVATQVALVLNGMVLVALGEEWESLALGVAAGSTGIATVRDNEATQVE